MFGLVTFQIKPPHLATKVGTEAQHLAEMNSATEATYDRITTVGEFALTSALVGDAFLIRVVAATPVVEERHLEELFRSIVANARAVNGAES